MAQAAEKILSTLAPHLRTVGVALRGAGASLMAYAPPAAADVGAQLEANGARPSVAAGAFVAPTATLIGDVSVGAAAAVNYGAVVEANGARLPIDGYVGDGAVVKSPVGEGALVGPNAVVLGAVESNAVVGAGAIVGAGATVLGNLGPGSLLEPGASVPATGSGAARPPPRSGTLDARDLEQATAARTLAAEAAATHRDECAKDYATLLEGGRRLGGLRGAPPQVLQASSPSDALDEMTQVGGMDTGVAVPGRILNSRIHAADGAAPHGGATRHRAVSCFLPIYPKCAGGDARRRCGWPAFRSHVLPRSPGPRALRFMHRSDLQGVLTRAAARRVRGARSLWYIPSVAPAPRPPHARLYLKNRGVARVKAANTTAASPDYPPHAARPLGNGGSKIQRPRRGVPRVAESRNWAASASRSP